MKNKAQFQVSLSGYLSNTLEWFDFTIFAVFAPLLATVFFPFENQQTGLLLTYASYGLGYCIRPLGGIVFGYLGDRIGRKNTLLITLSIITVSTTAIGLLPSYAQIGILAPILLTLLRAFQGFSVGGETAGSLVYAFESASVNNRGFITTLVWVGSGSGLLLATLTKTILLHSLTSAQMLSWGFRLPFLFSVLTTILIFCIRSRLSESKIFQELKAKTVKNKTLVRTLKESKLYILKVILLFAPSGMMFNLLFIFVPQNLDKSSLQYNDVMIINTISLVLIVTGSVFFGWLSDKVNRKKMLVTSIIIAIITIIPLYKLLFVNSLIIYAIAQLSLTTIIALYSGAAAPFALEMLPIQTRNTILGTAYNLTNGFISSTALTLFALFHHSGFSTAPAIYVLIYFVGILFIR